MKHKNKYLGYRGLRLPHSLALICSGVSVVNVGWVEHSETQHPKQKNIPRNKAKWFVKLLGFLMSTQPKFTF
jgi:hypothetical protein